MKQMKPVIGVTPLWDEEKDSIWMLPGYMDGITESGGIPVILPFSEDEQELEQLCPSCRSRVQEERCICCGSTITSGTGGVNPAFDPERFSALKRGEQL